LWVHVTSHFEKFLAELELTADQRSDALGKAERVARSLAAKYYPTQPYSPNLAIRAGSLGKGTAIRPPSDVDVIFILPRTDFYRIDRLTGNKHSQLLQEVKNTLLNTFPNTDVRGDGPVVKVPFSTYACELLPVFVCDDGTHLTAHTRDGGSWRYSNPHAEYKWLVDVDGRTGGKATHLIKMVKAWKRECNVDIKSICLEIVAGVFVDAWQHRNQTIFYYDWMIRDFFQHMLTTLAVDGWAKPAGVDLKIPLGNNWQNKARTAYERALKACEYEHADNGYAASMEWRKIFGSQFALDVPNLLALAGLLGKP
jgi:hypothetical protein